MAKDRSKIVKRSRRLGITLGKENCVRRRPYPPGIHGPKNIKRRPRLSSYGEQLLEKQKAKALYGILERQFRGYYEKASKKTGNTAEVMLQLLELRLDNIIYRLGIAKTRRQARQIVNHGFIEVNGKRVDIPSFSAKIGDEISIKKSKLEKGIIKQGIENIKETQVPSWLARDEKAITGKVTALPASEDIEQLFDSTLIVEFYSR